MKSLGRALGFGAFFFCLAAIASANPGEEQQEVAPLEPYSWTGFYIGGNVGGTWDNYRLGSFAENVDIVHQFGDLFPFELGIATPAFPSVLVHFPESDPLEGSFFGGGQIGYAKQWGRWVVGVEGDFDALSTSLRKSYPFSGSVATGTDSAQTQGVATREGSTDWNASLRTRVGYATGRWLLYLTGGLAFAEVTGRADDVAVTNFFMNGVPAGTITSTNQSSQSDILAGWTAGGGIDYWMTRSVSVGAEYRYSNFGGHNFGFDDHGGAINSGNTSVELSSHQATIRVNVLLSNLFGKH
jgi:outer membrane immunogenic protein